MGTSSSSKSCCCTETSVAPGRETTTLEPVPDEKAFQQTVHSEPERQEDDVVADQKVVSADSLQCLEQLPVEAVKPAEAMVNIVSVELAIGNPSEPPQEEKSTTWGEIIRESSYSSNQNIADGDPMKDKYIGDIEGKQFVADFAGCEIESGHKKDIASQMVGGVNVVNLNYANCKSVTDELLFDLAGLFPQVVDSAGTGLRALSLCFRSCSKISDAGILCLSNNLPPTLHVLELDLRFCTKPTDRGIATIARDMPPNLQRLALKFRCAGKLGDPGLVALGKSLPSKLESFEFGCCKCSQVGIGGFLGIMQNLPSQLRSLCLGFEFCLRVNDDCLAGLAELLPRNLQVLTINCWQCLQISDAGIAALAKRLPSKLEYLTVRVRSCKGIGNPGATALAQALPKSLVTLHIDLSFCPKVDDSAVMAFALGCPDSVKDLELNCQNTRVSKPQLACPDKLRALRSDGDLAKVVEPAKPASPPDPKKFEVQAATAIDVLPM